MKSTKKSLVLSVVSMLLCVAMLAGTTFAWFTDSVTSGANRIVAGNLDVDLVMFDKTANQYVSIGGDDGDIFSQAAGGNGVNWEPGKTEIVYLGVRNLGSLALKYNILLRVIDGGLIGSLEYALIDGIDYATATAMNVTSWAQLTAIPGVVKGDLAAGISLVAQNGCLDEIVHGTQNETDYFVLAVHMKESAGNEYMSKPGAEKYVTIDLTVNATQYTAESDSFDQNYDKQAYDNCLTNGHSYSFDQNTGNYSCTVCNETFDGPYFALLNDALQPTQIYALTSANADALEAYGVSFTGDRVYYTNRGFERKVAFRTAGGELVITAPNDTVYRYGKVENVYIMQVAEHSYYEYGIVGDLVVIDKGHVVINASAKVNDLSVAKNADAVNVSFDISDGTVETVAVYDAQKDVVKIGSQTAKEAADAQDNSNVVLIPDEKLARIGQTLYDTVVDAMAASQNGDEVRVVNDDIANATVVENKTLKVSFDIKLEVKDDDKLEIKATGVLVNCGTILTVGEPTEGNEVGLQNNGEIINNGDILNNDGQKLCNAKTIINYGNIENNDASSLENTKTIINNGNIKTGGSLSNNSGATVFNNGTIEGSVSGEGTVENQSVHTHTLTEHAVDSKNCRYYTCECGKYFSDAEAKTEITANSWIHSMVDGECTKCGFKYVGKIQIHNSDLTKYVRIENGKLYNHDGEEVSSILDGAMTFDFATNTLKLMDDVNVNQIDFTCDADGYGSAILDLNGHILTCNSWTAIDIYKNTNKSENPNGKEGYHLTINDSDPTVKHKGYITFWKRAYSWILAEDVENMVSGMSIVTEYDIDGGIIMNENGMKYGSGVGDPYDGAIISTVGNVNLTMNGGTLAGGRGDGDIGGICMNRNYGALCNLTLNNNAGVVGCCAAAGGIECINCNFTMNGNAHISYCSANNGGYYPGGAIAMSCGDSNIRCVINGGRIDHCISQEWGDSGFAGDSAVINTDDYFEGKVILNNTVIEDCRGRTLFFFWGSDNVDLELNNVTFIDCNVSGAYTCWQTGGKLVISGTTSFNEGCTTFGWDEVFDQNDHTTLITGGDFTNLPDSIEAWFGSDAGVVISGGKFTVARQAWVEAHLAEGKTVVNNNDGTVSVQ